MGSPDEPNAYYSNESNFYESIFNMILKQYDEMSESNIIKTIIFDTDIQEYWSEWFIRFV